jgi:hypothetical protein
VDIVITFEINHDLPGTKMVSLPQIDDFPQYFRIGRSGTMNRPTRTIYEAFFSKLEISALPFVEGIPTDSIVLTGLGNVMGYLLEVPEDS